ncbi:Ribosome-binding factor A [Liberibacter crescens BT-1]|uniref:Ribosome-binding factor A n=1 Tax=Liberibacter crescens (strain BT-1) TaxID=1215343 RepID=L0ERD2_LIBCB|nr:ribosome-binding factor A [Liberibacter crescens]AGA64024.1 Ribosome-binding factor A [Liberibacter crescens BT-1]AMC12332.1 ribosome-binding factor A [Liberibacter crescens]
MVKSKTSRGLVRTLRVGEKIRAVLMELLFKDGFLNILINNTTILISEVRMSGDLKIATAYVSLPQEINHNEIISILNSNSKFIRGRIGKILKDLKYIPEIYFKDDNSFQNYSKVDALLRSPKVVVDLLKPNVAE